MNQRKRIILNTVIDSYSTNAEPVGSRFLLSTGVVDCGEATIRNELRALEEDGYLTHPHTSAGRIPTKKGYRYFVDNLDAKNFKIAKKDNQVLGMSVKNKVDYRTSRKDLAKALVDLSGETVILAFSEDSVYYTGLANLFSKPEFNELDIVADISKIFDHCEGCLESFFESAEDGLKILIGDEHDFGDMLSVVVGKFKSENDCDGLLALVGPMRMDYSRNFSLMKKVQEII